MKILIACIHYAVASGRYAADAFRRLGHDVKTIGPGAGNTIWGLAIDPKYTWWPDGDLTAHWAGWTPDLIVVMDSAFAYHHPSYNAPHVIWGVDNHVRDYRQHGIDHYFLAHNAASCMDMMADDVSWLPCAYDPVWFKPSPIAWDERPFDVALVGVMYEKRWIVAREMEAQGLKVLVTTGLVYDQYAAAYHNARMALNVSAAGDLNQRIFETAALGCAVLTDDVPDLQAMDVENVYVYKSPSHAAHVAKAILKEKPIIRTRWLWEHTWDSRAEELLKKWEELDGIRREGEAIP